MVGSPSRADVLSDRSEAAASRLVVGPMRGAAGCADAQAGWWAASIGLFVAIWELGGWLGRSEGAAAATSVPRRLSQPGAVFDTSQVIAGEEARGAAWGVAHSVSATILRVLVGLALGFALAVLVGIGTRYFRLFGKLVLPSVTLLAPVSPLAWLPVAIYTFGTGNGPAVFLVFVAVFFIIVLATISEIDSVGPTYLNVARTMGASRAQTYRLVILPAILAGPVHDPAAQSVRRLDDRPGRRVRRRGQRARAGDHDRSQHLQLAARVLHHRDHRDRRLRIDSLLRQVQKRMLYWLPDEQAALGR